MNKEKDQLLEEISIEEDIIAKLPTYKETNDRAAWQTRAKHQTNRLEKLIQLEVIDEKERIALGEKSCLNRCYVYLM